jgi:hypothetical protein
MVVVSKLKIIQRFVLGQQYATSEFAYLSILLNGYCDKEINNNCRLVINFLNLPILIEYLTNHKLASVKTKSFEK